jgi:4-amino-4-deoxy-L-arabinose transferase-like glycosyltransferase
MLSEESRKEVLWLALVIGLGLLLRMDFLLASDFRIDSDEAIVGLMAKHILDGRGIPTFYFGQHYMGSLEAILSCISFSLIGVSSAALKLVPLWFSLVLIMVVYYLGRELGGVIVGRLASLFMAVAPGTLLVWSAKARGGYIELVVIGALALLLSCRSLRSKRPSFTLTILVALLLGLGWWVNNQIIYFMLHLAHP